MLTSMCFLLPKNSSVTVSSYISVFKVLELMFVVMDDDTWIPLLVLMILSNLLC